MNEYWLIVTVIAAFVLSAIVTAVQIPIMKKRQFGQYVREEGPKEHYKKAGTPTMGGISIVLAVVSVSIAFSFSRNIAVLTIVTLLFSSIGFLDDYIKVAAKQNLGLTGKQKLILQMAFGAVFSAYIAYFTPMGTQVYIPIFDQYVNFGIGYIPFVTFVMVAMANSVNLTDGLDGLCAGVTSIVAAFFAIIGLSLSMQAPTVFSISILGACLGFLLFNKNPAKIFMGDTGSMALGAGVAAAAIMMKMEFLLIIAGIIYVMESLSVIIQVISFKTRGKRVFKMSPIHHHFEMSGMKERKVVIMFWIVTLISCLIAYMIYMI